MHTVSTVRKQEKQETSVWDINKNEKANTTIFKYHYLSHSPPTSNLFFLQVEQLVDLMESIAEVEPEQVIMYKLPTEPENHRESNTASVQRFIINYIHLYVHT
jgi:hypothetical protein